MTYPTPETSSRFALSLLLALLVGGVLAACGGNSLQGDTVAEIGLDAPEGTQALALEPPVDTGKHGEPSNIRFKSTGKKKLKITDLTMENAPQRLLYRGEETETSCEFQAEEAGPPWTGVGGSCAGNGEYCEDVSSTCRKTSLPETPITIEKAASVEYRFFIAAAQTNVVECPEAPSDVPQEFKADYCGELKVKSNAATDSDIFKKGNATFYFQYEDGDGGNGGNGGGGRSGKIDFNPMTLSFKGIRPGVSKSRPLTVINNGSNELTIEAISLSNFRSAVTVQPTDSGSSNLPYTIPDGESMKFDVKIDVPESIETSDIPNQFFIEFDNSATRLKESVKVNLATGLELGPVIDLDKTSLSFAGGGTRTINIQNIGKKTLALSKLTFSESGLGDKYAFTYKYTSNGEQKTKEIEKDQSGRRLIAQNLQPGDSAKLEVEFTGNTGGVGEMKIIHNDEAIDKLSRVLLLGPNDSGYAEIVPGSLTFNYGKQASRTVLVRNRGTAPLALDSPGFETPEGDPDAVPANFTAQGALARTEDQPIAPGSIATGRLEFEGTDGDMGSQLNFQFRTDGLRQGTTDVQMPVYAESKPMGSKGLEAVIAKKNGAQQDAVVDRAMTLTAANSKNNADYSGDVWYVLERPEESDFFRVSRGSETFKFRPDVAGTYKIGLTLVEGTSQQSQDTITIEAKAP